MRLAARGKTPASLVRRIHVMIPFKRGHLVQLILTRHAVSNLIVPGVTVELNKQNMFRDEARMHARTQARKLESKHGKKVGKQQECRQNRHTSF